MKIQRRDFLRAAGVTLALPWLESRAFCRQGIREVPRRLVCICTPLGMHAPHFFPEKSGRDYEAGPYLQVLEEFRDQVTVISGLAHPDVGSSHDSIYSYLTAVPHPELRAGFRNTLSLDQFAAEKLGGKTRVASLTLSGEGFSLGWTRSGAMVPSDTSPAAVFTRLFLEGRPEEVKAQALRLKDGRSILDAVRGQAKALEPSLASVDREKMDEYFTSVRDLERQLAVAEEWSKKPKPKVDAAKPQDIGNSADVIGRTRLLFDLVHLAIQTDSTRIATLLLTGTSLVPPIAGVSFGHHDLSHHGQDPSKLAQLKTVELEIMKLLRDLCAKLKQSKEGEATLLDRTTIFFGSNLGNASSHAVKNLPILVAGGGFKHGQHLAFPAAGAPPLSNLYVSFLQRLGIEADKFGSSTGTLTGLEMANC